MAAAPSDKKKVMDVAKPGKSAPSATTRPLIVSHSGSLMDPTVNSDVKSAPVPSADALNGESGVAATKPRGPKVVQPLNAPADESTDTTEDKKAESRENLPILPVGTVTEMSEETEETSTDIDRDESTQQMADKDLLTSSEESSTEDSAEMETGKKSSAESESDDDTDESSKEAENAAVVDAVVDQATLGKKQKEEDKEAFARKELVAKLIEEKKYFIPIKQKNTTRSGRMTMFLSVFGVLVILGGYAAVDMGVVDPGFEVPFHILKKKELATSVTTPAATPVTNTPVSAQPAAPQVAPGTLTYDNKELSISFTYPSAWGEVAMKKQPSPTTGESVILTFSKQPMMRAGMISKSYKAPGKDGVCYEMPGIYPGVSLTTIKAQYADGDSTYNTSSYKTTTKFLKVTGDSLVYERFEAGQPEGMGACDGLTVAAYRSFTAGLYTGVQFLWANPDRQKVTPVSEFAQYKATPNNYLSEIDRKDILAVLESVKNQ